MALSLSATLAQSVGDAVDIASTQGALSRITGAWPSYIPRVKSDQHFAHKRKPADRVLGASQVAARISKLYKPFAKNCPPSSRQCAVPYWNPSSLSPPCLRLIKPYLGPSFTRPWPCFSTLFCRARAEWHRPQRTSFDKRARSYCRCQMTPSLAKREGLADPPCAARK